MATLLIFTLAPATERRRRRLLPQNAAPSEVALYAETVAGLVAAGQQAGAEVLISSPDPLKMAGATHLNQCGSTFQERLSAAVQAAQTPGRPLIVVPSDVPALSARHVAHASAAVTSNPRTVVLGPTSVGGIYLIASSLPMTEWFAEVRWRSPKVLGDLLRILDREGLQVELLEPLTELDTRAALEHVAVSCEIVAANVRAVLRRIRRQLLELKLCIFLPLPPPCPAWTRSLAGPRAPPLPLF